MTRLANKIAFVTGAGGGIGQAVCERFLAEGASVAAADIHLESASEAVSSGVEGARGIAMQCDAGDSDEVRDAIAQTVTTFGKLDILCNIAGGSSGEDGSVTDAPEAEFWRVIRLDLFGTFVSCKWGLPALIDAGGGAVINMTSMAALMALPGRDCYTAAKGGVAALTRSMAAEYGRHGIRVNAIAPGITLTPRVRLAVAGNEQFQQLQARHLLGTAEPIDIAHMAVYLASEEARRVTGHVFPVDSGVTIH